MRYHVCTILFIRPFPQDSDPFSVEIDKRKLVRDLKEQINEVSKEGGRGWGACLYVAINFFITRIHTGDIPQLSRGKILFLYVNQQLIMHRYLILIVRKKSFQKPTIIVVGLLHT